MALYTEIIIDQGSNYSGVIPVTNEENLPIDITGYTARGQLRKSYTSKKAINFTTQIDDPASGKVFVSLTPQQTSTMKPGRYVYDVEIYDTNEVNVIRISEGQAIVTPNVTKPDDFDNLYCSP